MVENRPDFLANATTDIKTMPFLDFSGAIQVSIWDMKWGYGA